MCVSLLHVPCSFLHVFLHIHGMLLHGVGVLLSCPRFLPSPFGCMPSHPREEVFFMVTMDK